MTGAVNRDFWRCGSFADFAAGTALGEPRSTDFVAGTALGEPRSADSWQAQHLVNLEVQIRGRHSTW